VSEFSIIDRYCQAIGQQHPSTVIGVGDDAAVVRIPHNMELAVSVDTMVEGVHFLADVGAGDLAHKLLAVNLSDMAAMGAEPKWATIALTLPKPDQQWLAAFSASLDELARRFGVQLIGGDTTRGPLSLSLNIMGLLPISKALTRSGARVGDTVYVSNCIGDAALALSAVRGDVALKASDKAKVLPALLRPQPQVELGLALLELASACLDVSDGLVADLAHIATRSEVSIEIDVDAVPVSKVYQHYLDNGGVHDLALTGGDDYQLAFSVSEENTPSIADLSEDLNIDLKQIGYVVPQANRPVILSRNGAPYRLASANGYQHFG